MKRWNDLSVEQQKDVLARELTAFIEDLLELGLRGIGPEDHPVLVQARQIAEEIEHIQTLWFPGGSLFDDPVAMDWVATEIAKYIRNAIYLEPGEFAICEPIIQEGSENG